ncbi:MAG: HlyD family efflux transporter periplasmic adaptor subunit, partial [Treponema sp.]|nr:HlyD family efflux transporter periplasmic adaptor subunit [Treponema sp.]
MIKTNKKKSSGRITLVIVALILVFAGLIVTSYLGIGEPAEGGGGAQTGGGQVRSATVIRARPVAPDTIENSLVINGDVLAQTQVSIYPTMAGKITEMRLQVGDRVSQGQTVAMVDPSRPGEVYSHSPVTSTISGTVLQVPVTPGDTVTTGTAVYVVGNLQSLVVETFVPERFSTAVRMNLSAQV